jgi:peptidoglycan hydrolase-like protein with peptidoglycan-binding domain
MITVSNASGNVSNQLVVSPFTVGTTATSAAAATNTSGVASQLQALEAQLAQLQSQTSATTTTTTAATSYNFTEFLSIGSQDAQVTALQKRLAANGFYSGAITGYYGTLTQTAVEKFQSAHGIAVKGYVGPGTRAALNAGE